MAYAPGPSRAKRTRSSSLARQLYPEDDPQDPVMEEPDEDAGDEQDAAAEKSPIKPLSQKEMADKVYPDDAEGEDESEDSADARDDEGTEDEGGSEDKEPGDEDDPAQGENGQAAQDAANRMHGVLGMFGVKPSGEQNSKEAKGAAKLEAGLRKAIADAEASKGAPLTSDEEQNISGEYIANHAMKWLPLRKHDPDRLVKIMWDGAGPAYNNKCGATFRAAFKKADGNPQAVGGKNPPGGKDWGPTLEKNGYEKVVTKNYQPQNGDVRVISGVPPKDPKNPTPPEKWGHVQVYDGEHNQWVSERKEGPAGISSVFRDGHASIAVYRFNPF